MATAREKIDQAAELVSSNKERVSQIGAVYKFELEGDDGGKWVFDLTEDPKVIEGDGEAQCTIKMAAGDYVDMVEGRANPQQLFFAGKLRIEGDVGLAMKLQQLTDMLS